MNAQAPVLLDVADGIGQLTFNRPDQGNAMDLAFSQELHRLLQRCADDPAVRVVLLTGQGRLFCAGGDVQAMGAAADRGAFLSELAGAAHGAIRTLAALTKPVVAAVQGSAAGAGLSLVLQSDLVLATQKTTFVTAYSAVGLTPDCGQSWLLPRVVGLGRALDMTLTSRRVFAEEALALGLITRIVEEESLLEQARVLARRLADGPAEAAGQARALLRGGFAAEFDAHLDREATMIARMAASEQADALIGAFLHGR
jgi:2-(1,2-epoxy-1,2-dihydrophenyl)acetyl-CoA isomerase